MGVREANSGAGNAASADASASKITGCLKYIRKQKAALSCVSPTSGRRAKTLQLPKNKRTASAAMLDGSGGEGGGDAAAPDGPEHEPKG